MFRIFDLNQVGIGLVHKSQTDFSEFLKLYLWDFQLGWDSGPAAVAAEPKFLNFLADPSQRYTTESIPCENQLRHGIDSWDGERKD